MNYYPYFSYTPISAPTSAPAATGLFGRIFHNGINWGNIINNTQKTLNIINQTIPVVKQVSPIIKNAKTMFKVMSEFKKTDTSPNLNRTYQDATSNINTNQAADNTSSNYSSEIGPTFFA